MVHCAATRELAIARYSTVTLLRDLSSARATPIDLSKHELAVSGLSFDADARALGATMLYSCSSGGDVVAFRVRAGGASVESHVIASSEGELCGLTVCGGTAFVVGAVSMRTYMGMAVLRSTGRLNFIAAHHDGEMTPGTDARPLAAGAVLWHSMTQTHDAMRAHAGRDTRG
jgi:hypothetical protein